MLGRGVNIGVWYTLLEGGLRNYGNKSFNTSSLELEIYAHFNATYLRPACSDSALETELD